MSSHERVLGSPEAQPKLSLADYLSRAWEQKVAIETMENAKDPSMWQLLAHVNGSWNRHHQIAELGMAPHLLSVEETNNFHTYLQIQRQNRTPHPGETAQYEAGQAAYEKLQSKLVEIRSRPALPEDFGGRLFPERASRQIREYLDQTDHLLADKSAAA